MNRRDFLKKGTGDFFSRSEKGTGDFSEQAVELSCQTLYMRYVDAQAAADTDIPHTAEMIDGLPSGGEPPAVYDRQTPHQLFDDLEQALTDVQVLRVTQPQWLVGEIQRDFERAVASFCARGGQVVIEH